jgi:hypothetical protein
LNGDAEKISLKNMTIFFVALVMTFSGFINSLTGFGFIIVAAPFLIQLLPPKETASVALVLGIILAAIKIIVGSIVVGVARVLAIRNLQSLGKKSGFKGQAENSMTHDDGFGKIRSRITRYASRLFSYFLGRPLRLLARAPELALTCS